MRERPLILICDDDEAFLDALYLQLKLKYEVHRSTTVVQAKMMVQKYEYDAAIIDLNYEGQELDGVNLLDHTSKNLPGTFLIVLSGDQSTKRVVQAMRRKLFDFVPKDECMGETLIATLDRAMQIRAAHSKSVTENYLTKSPGVNSILQTAERITRSSNEASILILGETGSGKEVLARHIAHRVSKRSVTANMASIPKETAESILFGHEKGAFTGAFANKIGLIESANKGIFFLDEIGEASPAVQSKLLRVLQEKEITPLGSNRSRKVDVQFIAATHRDLNRMVEEGMFRLDLLQRLNTFVLTLLPLRERPEDICLYAHMFLDEMADQNVKYRLADCATSVLLSYNWPGNIRELKSVIQRIVILSDKTFIEAADVESAIRMGNEKKILNKNQILESASIQRRENLIRVLREVGGNKRAAAKTLNISEATLYRWVNDLGLASLVKRSSLFAESLQSAEGLA